MVVVRFGVVTRLLRQRYGTNSLNIHEVCEDRFDVGSISGAMATVTRVSTIVEILKIGSTLVFSNKNSVNCIL